MCRSQMMMNCLKTKSRIPKVLATKKTLILREVEEGTGAKIAAERYRETAQSGIRLWFADLGRPRSPIVTLRPTGLHRFEARLTFGHFSAATIAQMQQAGDEELQLARALVKSIAKSADVRIGTDHSLDSWCVDGASFTIVAEKRGIDRRFGDDALTATCRELVIPILAAMAELYGYDRVKEVDLDDQEPVMEGSVRLSLVTLRERNPRSRLLCQRMHGSRCVVCKLDPRSYYGNAGSIMEVHHLQPLSLSGEARSYDPATDLVPLCPNCHRAVHTRRPVPWTPKEIRDGLVSNA